MHSDRKRRRSFLALLIASGDARLFEVSEMEDETDDDGMYPVFDKIDFSKIHRLFRDLVLLDDMYTRLYASFRLLISGQ